MYKPKYAENTDIAAIKNFIRNNGFAIIVSQHQQKLVASHIPLELSRDETKLLGHVSRANSQWKNFNDDVEVLAIFTGPHAYISSSWYDHENVPTWNYIAVHVYGTVKIIEGPDLYNSLKELVDKYESSSAHPVSIERMSEDYVRKSIKGLVGFEITITRFEAASKLSQNRDAKNQNRIITELHKRSDFLSRQIASEMEKNISRMA